MYNNFSSLSVNWTTKSENYITNIVKSEATCVTLSADVPQLLSRRSEQSPMTFR